MSCALYALLTNEKTKIKNYKHACSATNTSAKLTDVCHRDEDVSLRLNRREPVVSGDLDTNNYANNMAL